MYHNDHSYYTLEPKENEALEMYTPFEAQEAAVFEEDDEPVYEKQLDEGNRFTRELDDEVNVPSYERLYSTMDLRSRGLAMDTFAIAYNGYRILDQNDKLKNNRILTVVDFSQPSTSRRMYVVDLTIPKILLQCKVSHGKNSVRPGGNKKNATVFSNRIGSNQSSLGFFVTLKTYQGKNGLSLQLEGLENDFNSNAKRRRVVVHGATYVREDSAATPGMSWGCPAVDMKLVKPLIDTIKDGSCFFIFSKDAEYLSRSSFVVSGFTNKIKSIASGIVKAGASVLSGAAAKPLPSALPVAGVDKKTVARIQQFAELIERISREKSFNPNIVRGIIAAESAGNPRSGEGTTGYKGLMQAERDADQLNPEVSIRRGIEKFIAFKGYLRSGLSRLGVTVAVPDDEAYAKQVLTCYNAGHVTVIKAIQYATLSGNSHQWLEPVHYQRALLFTGGYDLYSSCAKGASEAEVTKARQQRSHYRFKKNKSWWLQPDPPPWNEVSVSLSPVLRCWIGTKMKNTPGYLSRFITYFRYFNSSSLKSNELEFYDEAVEEQYEHSHDQTETTEAYEFSPETESEDFEEYYGPNYFDSGDHEDIHQEEFLEESESKWDTEWEEENIAQDVAEEQYLEEAEFYETEDEPVYETDEFMDEVAVSNVPPLMSEDLSVPGYTCYVKIDLGNGNYPLHKTGIYIPSTFDPSQPVDVILYLHGMTGTFPGATAAIDKYWSLTKLPKYDFRLREEVNRSGRNAILLAPSLGNSPNAYKNYLSGKRGGLDAYIEKVLQAVNYYIVQRRFNLPAINLRGIILAAHSAGGSQMRNIVTSVNPIYGGKITECWGFDSLYGGVYVWLKWAQNNPAKKLFVYYLGSTAGNSELLKNLTRKLSNVQVKRSTAKNHYLVPKEHLRERLFH